MSSGTDERKTEEHVETSGNKNVQDKEERKDIFEQRSGDHAETSVNKNEHESDNHGVLFRNFWNRNPNENKNQGDASGNRQENGDVDRLSNAKTVSEMKILVTRVELAVLKNFKAGAKELTIILLSRFQSYNIYYYILIVMIASLKCKFYYFKFIVAISYYRKSFFVYHMYNILRH